MLPMIDTLHEVRQAKLLLQEAQRDANVCIDHMPEIGIMIETPAAVLGRLFCAGPGDGFF